MIGVDTWPVSQFETAKNSGTLTVSPEYQRRPVWAQKDQMLLIDSIARGVPIGAITLYVDDSEGYEVYEVIDGKQRLSAIFDFLAGQLSIKTGVVKKAAVDDDEFDLTEDEVTAHFHERSFDALGVPEKFKIRQYKVPIFLVTGQRGNAIRAFARMNRSSYALKPQEIRNAFFTDTVFLNTVIGINEELDTSAFGSTGELANSLLVQLGAISRQAWDRMQDIQFVSELLVLVLDGPQHRRDSLDEFYSLYVQPKGDAAKKLTNSAARLTALLQQLWALCDDSPLQAFHFPGACENDVYGIVGALNARGLLTQPQMKDLKAELMTVIASFRAQVEEFIGKVRAGETPLPDEFDPLVEKYGRGFLGGQTNAKSRRQERIEIWVEVINGLVATLDPQASFSEVQRRLIWAHSADKLCARCGQPVSWELYHAGHKVPWSKGGRTTVDNGQVEHATCNLTAGARGVEGLPLNGGVPEDSGEPA